MVRKLMIFLITRKLQQRIHDKDPKLLSGRMIVLKVASYCLMKGQACTPSHLREEKEDEDPLRLAVLAEHSARRDSGV